MAHGQNLSAVTLEHTRWQAAALGIEQGAQALSTQGNRSRHQGSMMNSSRAAAGPGPHRGVQGVTVVPRKQSWPPPRFGGLPLSSEPRGRQPPLGPEPPFPL